jgi:hypothetical protein
MTHPASRWSHPVFTKEGQNAKVEEWRKRIVAHAKTLFNVPEVLGPDGKSEKLSPEQNQEAMDQVWAVLDPDGKGYIEGDMLIHTVLALEMEDKIHDATHRVEGYTYEEMLKHPKETENAINRMVGNLNEMNEANNPENKDPKEDKDPKLSKAVFSAVAFEILKMTEDLTGNFLVHALYYTAFIMDKPGGMDEIEAAGAEWDKPREEALAAQKAAAEAEQNKIKNKELCRERMRILIDKIHWKLSVGKEYPVAEAPVLLDQLEACVAQMPGGLPPHMQFTGAPGENDSE